MGIKRDELVILKGKIKAEMTRRNGKGPQSGAKWTPPKAFGSLNNYADSSYDFVHTPTKDQKIYSEYGEKTINILRETMKDADYDKAADGMPISTRFQSGIIDYVDKLSAEKFTGETDNTISKRESIGENVSGMKPESSSCRAQCSGICVGSCIGMCNGCIGGCTGECKANCFNSCGTGCAGSVMVSTGTSNRL